MGSRCPRCLERSQQRRVWDSNPRGRVNALAVFKGADHRIPASLRILSSLVFAGQQRDSVPPHPCESLRIPARVFSKCSTSRSRVSPARPVSHLRLPGRFPEGARHFEGCEWPGVSCSGGQISHRDRLPGGVWPRSDRPSGQLSYQHNVPLRSRGMASSTVQGRIPAASPGARCHVRAGAVLRRLSDRQGVMWRCGSWSGMLRWRLSLTTWRLGGWATR